MKRLHYYEFRIKMSVKHPFMPALSIFRDTSQTYHHVVVSDLVQIDAALSVSELSDADTVRRMKLFHKEATTGFDHL